MANPSGPWGLLLRGPGTPARYRIGGGWAVAAVGFTTPHFPPTCCCAAPKYDVSNRTSRRPRGNTAVERGRDACRGGPVA